MYKIILAYKTDLDGCWSRGESNQGASSFITDSRTVRIEEVVDAPYKACSLPWISMTHLQLPHPLIINLIILPINYIVRGSVQKNNTNLSISIYLLTGTSQRVGCLCGRPQFSLFWHSFVEHFIPQLLSLSVCNTHLLY